MGILDDGRDQVRNAGLLLLVDMTGGANEDLKKIVAFEDVFAKVFALIQAEGGLSEAGITAQDCLSLLANLISSSASNQTMFRESGCINQLAPLLQQAFPPSTPEAAFLAQNREKAAWGLLQLLGLFLVEGEASTAQNQHGFFRAGIAQILIELGFNEGLPSPVAVLALDCAAALIASNAPLQEAFANLTIVSPSAAPVESQPTTQVNGHRSAPPSAKGSARTSVEKVRIHIIEALLARTLGQVQAEPALRAASCNLIQAYLTNHDRIRMHFMTRAIAGHAGRETAPNVLLTLLDSETDVTAVVFASWIVCDLVANGNEAKAALAALKEGDEGEGEDVLTAVQTFGAHLQETLQQEPDVRRVAAYAELLMVFLWENAEGVNNLLAEGSGLLQALVGAVNAATSDPVVSGLAAALLGIIYEFSTKDSPIPRRTLAPLLNQKVGRPKYLAALTQLRKQPTVRDFDLAGLKESDRLLSAVFIELFTVEYTRLRRAIDKDPGVEVLPASAIEAGVDRDVLDDLRQQVQMSKDALSQVQQEALAAGQQRENERMATSKDLQTASAEVERLRKINHAMQQGHESEIQTLASKQEREKGDVNNAHARALAQIRQDADRQTQAALREREAGFALKIQEHERRLAEMGNAHRAEQSGHTQTRQQLEVLTARHTDVSAREKSATQQFEVLTLQHDKTQRANEQLQLRVPQLSEELQTASKELETRGEEVKRLGAQVAELKEELGGKNAELATERAGYGELERELDTARKDLSMAQNDLASTKKELETTKKQLDAAKKLATASVADAKKGLEQAGIPKASKEEQARFEQQAAELKELQEEIRKLGEASSQANEQVIKLQKEVEEAKEGEKSAKEELESMLLVMGDIEAKRDEYREKVSALGGQVSEEEDDDEEEEESDEDNDDLD